MADVGHRLRIKFGLVNSPSLEQQKLWASITDQLIRQGYASREAGEAAARQVFPDYDRMKFASEGDTIEMLLQQIKDK